ncbi:MAG: hypothetical protein HKN85_04880 [Gammaproteobacteria bacterium]|nr:hypothetical protein [Gammaproteobacteria bacterium]
MSEDKDKPATTMHNPPADTDNAILPQAEAGKRTVMLRVKSMPDNSEILQRVTACGARIISEGRGVIVVEADAETVTILSRDKDVLAVDEERKLEMRMRPMGPKSI